MSGASGFLGRALCDYLEARGARVRRLVRRPATGEDEISWSPNAGDIDPSALEGLDAIVHLAGENVGSGRWTAEKKERIKNSRVAGTRTLARAIAQLNLPPRVWISASGVGYYGHRGDELLDETASPADDFLSQVCQAWEAESRAAEGQTRVIQLRLGMVLGKGGGPLLKMLPFFKLGLGGRLGTGRQYLSWVALRDVLRATEYCLETESISGPVNCVAPTAVTNAEFTRALGKALHRPTVFPVPSFGLRALYGEITDDLMASQRAVPRVLLDAGFRFEHQNIDSALDEALG
jgi:uncharacterized protein